MPSSPPPPRLDPMIGRSTGVVGPTDVEARLAASGEGDVASLLIELAHEAASFAHPPMSDFHVGAAVVGGTGAAYFGANLELDGAPLHLAVHAEQTAVVNALMHGERTIRALGANAAPCGHCRQFLQELGSESILVATPKATYALHDLLPAPFLPSALGVSADALSSGPEPAPAPAPLRSLAEAAVTAAALSHAPYTESPAGVALELHDGSIVTGAYIESAAYNPSLDALRGALALARFRGWPENPVDRVALAHSSTCRIDHTHALRHTLTWLPNEPDTVEVHAIDSL